MRKVALYCRVSTHHQEKDETIQTQLSKLKKIYNKKEIVKEYKDEGYSGAYLQRPALNQLREDAKKGLFNVLALYSLDRLSRKTGHQLFLQDELKRYGVKIEILGESFKDTPQGEFSNTILSAVGQYEREMIRQRMMDGIRRRIENGTLIGCPAPYGYTLVKKDKSKGIEAHFEINPIEAKVIQELFHTFLNEKSIRATARKISEKKIYNGGYIQPNRVAEFLRDETYIGYFYYYKTRTYIKEDGEGRLKAIKERKPKSEWKLIKIPSIVDRTTFDRVQEILTEIKRNYIKKAKYNYLLQGLIKCIHCGAYYGGKPCSFSKGRPYFVYLCHNRRKPRLGQKKCSAVSIGSLTIEKAVWDYVKALISDPEKVKKAIKELQEGRENKKAVNQRIYDKLMGEKAKIKVRKSRILDLYANEKMKEEDLSKQMEQYNNQEIAIDRQIEETKKELQMIDKTNEIEKEIEKLCLEYKDKIDNAPFELKKMIVRKWIKEINITDEKKIVLKVRVPIFERIPFNLSKQIPQEKHSGEVSSTLNFGVRSLQ
jgi:site-specific DNA recombinase